MALIPLLLFIALFMRSTGGQTWSPGAFDSESAYHLRRAELAAVGRVPLLDRHLDPPRGAEPPWPPLYDAVIASCAMLYPAALPGEGAEEALWWVAQRLPLLLGLATIALLFCAARSILRGPHATWCALCAAGVYAASPAALASTSSGALHLSAAHACLAAGILWLAGLARAAGDGLDLLLVAFLGGLVAGLALALGWPALFYVPILWWAFLSSTRGSKPELHVDARRAGLFFCLVACCIPTATSQSFAAPDTESLAQLWLSGISALTLASAAPFLVGLLRHRGRALQSAAGESGERTERQRFQRVTRVLCIVGFAILLPMGARDAWRAYSTLGFDRIALSARPWTEPVPWLLVGAALAVACCRRKLSGERWPLPLFLAGACALAAAHVHPAHLPLAASLLAIPCAWLAGACARLYGRPAALVVALALLLGGVQAWRSNAQFMRSSSAHHEQLAALRDLRSELPSAGPWNAASAPPDWSILAPPALGLSLLYHARRPALLTEFGPLEDSPMYRAALSALTTESDPKALLDKCRALGVGYVLAGSGLQPYWSELEREARNLGLEPLTYERSALAALVNQPGNPAEWVTLAGGVWVLFKVGAGIEGARNQPSLRAR